MRVEQTAQITLTSGQSAVTQKFPGLKTGDSVQVQVLGFSGNKLLLKILNGATLRADFNGEALFLPGDQLDLALESRKGGKISFRLSTVNGQPVRMEVSDSENVLLRSGIEPTRQNLLLTGLLQKNGYAPTPQSLENLSRIMQNYPDLPDDVSSFFASNNIEPDSNAVQLIGQLQEGSSLLGNRADALIAAIKQYELPAQSIQSGQSGQIGPSVPEKVPLPVQTGSTLTGQAFQKAFMQNLQAADPQLAQSLTESGAFTKFLAQIPKTAPAGATAIAGFVSSLRLDASQEKAVASSLIAAFRETDQPAPDEAQPHPDQVIKPDPEPLQPHKSMPTAAATYSPPKAADLLQKLGEFFATVNPADIKATAQSLRNAVQKQEKLAEEVLSGVSSLTGEKSVLSQQSADIHSQVGLNGALENFFYVQIPLQFREQTSTAELYVFERNRKATQSRDCTILIALDMQNAGRVETVLRAEGNGLDLTLRLQSAAACRYAEGHASELKQSLSDSGFYIRNLAFNMLETKTTPTNAQTVFANLSSFTPGGLNIQV